MCVTGIEPKALGMLDKDSTTFLHPQTPNPVSIQLSALSAFLNPAYLLADTVEFLLGPLRTAPG